MRFFHRLAVVHQPSKIESKWIDRWRKAKLFNSPNKFNGSQVLLFPPPNVTGRLHLGHCLTATIEDSIIRHQRMKKGKMEHFVAGYDHAGIATQVMVEKDVMTKMKLTKDELGEETFRSQLDKWKTQKISEISSQLDKFATSVCEKDKRYYTMDHHHSVIVRNAFVRLWNSNHIYRQKKMINWCSTLRSVISDSEIDNVELKGKTQINVPGYRRPIDFGQMYYINYRLVDGNGVEIPVATTRPETILGDVALTVHPKGKYAKFIGQFVSHPLRDEYHLPILANENVDIEIGSGVCKITPGHDKSDYEYYLKEKSLTEIIEILDNEGNVTLDDENRFQIRQKKRYDVRDEIIDRLTISCKLTRIESHSMILPICSRSKDVIEPRLTYQYFLRCGDVKWKLLEELEHLRIEPDYSKRLMRNWLEKMNDWCISRQLWWGHRIPIIRLEFENKIKFICEANELETNRIIDEMKREHPHMKIIKENDVLDTWFSSALIPLAIQNWSLPQQSRPLQTLPLLESGYDIIFFWAIRMMVLSQLLENHRPFHHYLFHGLICDENGEKMSKSKGNVIDPIKLMEKGGKNNIGIDTIRLALASIQYKSQICKFHLSIIDQSKLFLNKLWNSFNFVRIISEKNSDPIRQFDEIKSDSFHISPVDFWMLGELNELIETVEQDWNHHSLPSIVNSIRSFHIKIFCDIYLSYIRDRLNRSTNVDESKFIISILHHIITIIVRLLHPIVPCMTEEIHEQLGNENFLILSSYPTPFSLEHETFNFHQLRREMTDIVHQLSSLRLQLQKKQIKMKSIQEIELNSRQFQSRRFMKNEILQIFLSSQFGSKFHFNLIDDSFQNPNIILNIKLK
ncbi:hypothetical protein SNEBB_011109 [Seison nebaliae]|nr:hypothetical protein SNEBB_011109 [Seison nebaliae]